VCFLWDTVYIYIYIYTNKQTDGAKHPTHAYTDSAGVGNEALTAASKFTRHSRCQRTNYAQICKFKL